MIKTIQSIHRSGQFFFVDAAASPGLETLVRFKIDSWSMFPTLQKGDRVECEPPDDLKAGDLVVFRSTRGALVCHRLVRIDSGGFFHTQGDAAGPDETPLGHSGIIGKVNRVIRRKRIFSSFRMRMDIWLGHAWARVAVTAARIFLACKSRRFIRVALSSLLGRTVRFYAGVPAGVGVVKGYHFMVWSPRLSGNPWPKETLFVARLAGFRVGTYEPCSGKLWIRPVLEGLGLEKQLTALGKNL